MKRLIATLVMAGAAVALALDAPHDNSGNVTCDSCHTLHSAAGGALTSVSGNANLCKSCHDARGAGFAWALDDQAVPGQSGHSHRWDAPAANASRGAQAPTNANLLKHLASGNLQCSTCHDQHSNVAGNHGTQRMSVTAGAAVTRVAGSGTGTFAVSAPAAAASAKGYLVEVVTAGAVGASTFRVSNDNGLSWFGWSGGAWTAGAVTGRPTAASVALNDGANVTVVFTGTFAVGDRWTFYVAYPLLQMSNVDDAMCENCHLPRVQSAAFVESGGDGTKVFSHPVGEALAKSYDKTAATILDANGSLQSAGDGLQTNNLKLDSASKVRCQTCHSIHNADSNSLTEDP